MKTIELKTIPMSGKDGDPNVIDYAEMIQTVASAPGAPNQPIVLAEQRRRVRILDALDEVDLSTEAERGQLSFLDECEGMCGL